MASQKKLLAISAAVALLVACSAMLAEAQFRVHAKGAIPPPPPPKKWNPWQGEVIPPEPRKGYYRYLKGCADILTDDCGLEVFDYTFLRIQELSPGCCVKLVKMGELCNKAMSLTLSQIERYKKWSGHIFERSTDAFYQCNKTVSAPTPK